MSSGGRGSAQELVEGTAYKSQRKKEADPGGSARTGGAPPQYPQLSRGNSSRTRSMDSSRVRMRPSSWASSSACRISENCGPGWEPRSGEHTSEIQSLKQLVCRLL